MKPQLLLVFASGLLLAADAPEKGSAEDDMKALQGAWHVVSVKYNGVEIPVTKDFKWTFSGNKVTTFGNNEVLQKLTYKLDATTKPKSIVVESDDPKPKPVHGPAIYALDGDTLKICFSTSDKRPKEFTDKGQHALYTFKRAKP